MKGKGLFMIKILVCFHRPYEIPKDELYLPIQVGKSKSKYNLHIQGDNELFQNDCPNISNLNSLYCELSAMYWAWKNIRKMYKDLNYIGLCHYRRYFYYPISPVKLKCIRIEDKLKLIISSLINKKVKLKTSVPEIEIPFVNSKKIDKFNHFLKDNIQNYDLIVTQPVITEGVNVKDFFNLIGKPYIDLLELIVYQNFKDYSKYLKKQLYSTILYSANMIIIKKDFFDEYCEFVFGVLNQHLLMVKDECICSNPENDKIYSRVLGYLGEILTSTFVLKSIDEGLQVFEAGRAFITNNGKNL